ncbi:histone acetyltransferases subunit 3-domain-containing protein [Dipodascopsis uninucleata]
MLPAGKSNKSKGKGKSRGVGSMGSSTGSNYDVQDISDSGTLAEYEELISTFIGRRSSSPDSSVSPISGAAGSVPALSALMLLQTDLKNLSTKAQSRVLRSQRLLRSLESQRTQLVQAASVADVAAATAAAAKAATDEEDIQAKKEATADAAANAVADNEEDLSAKGHDDRATSEPEDANETVNMPNERKGSGKKLPPKGRSDPRVKLEIMDEDDTSAISINTSVEKRTREASEAEEGEEDDGTEEDRKLAKKRLRSGEINPGSEFVTAQTIPSAALAFMEDDQVKDEESSQHIRGDNIRAKGEMPRSGTEDLKKLYGVASYPTNDLQDLLPGEIPDEDFSKSKPTNQVQFSTFLSYIEPYYRPFTEEDIGFLKEKADDLSPYLIPPLGPSYLDIWADEDGSTNGNSNSGNKVGDKSNVHPRGSLEFLTDETLETEEVSCGPLASRILSALLKDESDDANINGSTGGENGSGAAGSNGLGEDGTQQPVLSSSSAFAEQQGWRVSSVKADYQTLEDRLKREFRYVGILGEDEVDWSSREDDEICAELRRLQRRLKVVSNENAKRKKLLERVVMEQMAYQEYTQILEDLDKQVDQAYLKRSRTIKSKKKRGAAAAAAAHANTPGSIAGTPNPGMVAGLGEGIRALLDKRRRWIEKIGPVFPPAEVMKRIPRRTIFDSEEEKIEPKKEGQIDNSEPLNGATNTLNHDPNGSQANGIGISSNSGNVAGSVAIEDSRETA